MILKLIFRVSQNFQNKNFFLQIRKAKILIWYDFDLNFELEKSQIVSSNIWLDFMPR